MWIVLGIGNPGKKYARTRHNVGFRVADALAADLGITAWKEQFQALAAEAGTGDSKVLLLKPQTYVNLSGNSARAALDWYKESPGNLLVVLDDFALPTGKIRIRAKGSSGGHNGLDSILACAGTDEVPRMRIGIGPPAGTGARDYVLDAFSAEEEGKIARAVDRAVEAARAWMRGGIEAAMNKFNVEEP